MEHERSREILVVGGEPCPRSYSDTPSGLQQGHEHYCPEQNWPSNDLLGSTPYTALLLFSFQNPPTWLLHDDRSPRPTRSVKPQTGTYHPHDGVAIWDRGRSQTTQLTETRRRSTAWVVRKSSLVVRASRLRRTSIEPTVWGGGLLCKISQW